MGVCESAMGDICARVDWNGYYYNDEEAREGKSIMSEQNLYKISCESKDKSGRSRWDEGKGPGDTWQDAIRDWLWDVSYQVVSETPSEDGRSGSMEITQNTPPGRLLAKATIISDTWGD